MTFEKSKEVGEGEHPAGCRAGQWIGQCPFQAKVGPEPCPLQGRQLDSLSADGGTRHPTFHPSEATAGIMPLPGSRMGVRSMDLRGFPECGHCHGPSL